MHQEENTLWTRYQEALKKRFKRYFAYLDTKNQEIGEYLEGLPNQSTYLLSLYTENGGHATLLYKENDQYYYYDPNQNKIEFAKPMASLEELAREIKQYAKAISKTSQDKTVIMLDRVDISNVHYAQDEEPIESPEDEMPLKQHEILKLVAMYFNSEYNPIYLVEAKGVCYGLSCILRELMVQTGSPKKAGRQFNQALRQLSEKSKALGIDSSEDKTLSEDQMKVLGQDELLVAMIPYFHALQALSTSEEAKSLLSAEDPESKDRRVGMTQVRGSRMKQDYALEAMPLSIPMETLGKKEEDIVSNPMSIYELLKEADGNKLAKVIESLEQDNFDSVDRKELVQSIQSLDPYKFPSKVPSRLKKDVQFMDEVFNGRHTSSIPILSYFTDDELKIIVKGIREKVLERGIRRMLSDLSNPLLELDVYDQERYGSLLKDIFYIKYKDSPDFVVNFVLHRLQDEMYRHPDVFKTIQEDIDNREALLKDYLDSSGLLEQAKSILPEGELDRALQAILGPWFEKLSQGVENRVWAKKMTEKLATIQRNGVEQSSENVQEVRLAWDKMHQEDPGFFCDFLLGEVGYIPVSVDMLYHLMSDTLKEDEFLVDTLIENDDLNIALLPDTRLEKTLKDISKEQFLLIYSSEDPEFLKKGLSLKLKTDRAFVEDIILSLRSDPYFRRVSSSEKIFVKALPDDLRKDSSFMQRFVEQYPRAKKYLEGPSETEEIPEPLDNQDSDNQAVEESFERVELEEAKGNTARPGIIQNVVSYVGRAVGGLMSPWMDMSIWKGSKSSRDAQDLEVKSTQSKPMSRVESEGKKTVDHTPKI